MIRPEQHFSRASKVLSTRRIELSLCLILLACFVYFFPRWADWNQNSRFDLVRAVVEDHTIAIDRYVSNTGDYATFGGHYYSDKAPGLAILGMPVYAVFREVLPASAVGSTAVVGSNEQALGATLQRGGLGLDPERLYLFAALVTTSFVTVVVPSLILAIVFFLLSVHIGLNKREAFVSTALFALASPAFPYSNTFVSHQLSACLLVTAFFVLFRVRHRGLHRSWIVLAGFLLGYAALSEYPTILIVIIIGLYAICTLNDPIGTTVRLAVGFLPPMFLLAVHNELAFGTPLPIGYLHSSLFPDQMHTGFFSLTYPQPSALWGITFSPYRGLFFLSPYLLGAVLGYIVLWRIKAFRAEFWVLLVAPLGFLVFNSSSALWDGGFAVGPRYLLASLPFLALPAGVGVVCSWKRAAFRLPIIVTTVWSFAVVWAETIAGQSFPDYSPNPLFDFSLPRLAAGDIARNMGMFLGLAGWKSLIPLVVLAAVLVALAMRDGSIDQNAVVVDSGQVKGTLTWISQ